MYAADMYRTLTCLFVAAIFVHGFNNGADPGHSGVPGESNCAQCHAGTLNPPGGFISVEFPTGLNYLPSQRYTLTIRVSDPSARLFGFQLTVRSASNSRIQAGKLFSAETGTFVWCSSPDFTRQSEKPSIGCPTNQPIESIQQSSPRANPTNSWQVHWEAPPPGVGNVVVYVAGNAANGNGQNSGDRIFTASYILSVGGALPSNSISATPESLAFRMPQGGPLPAAQQVRVSTAAPAGFLASSNQQWLSVTPSASSAPSVLMVSVTSANLPPGTYNGIITIATTGSASTARGIAVNLVVEAPPPIVSPGAISVSIQQGLAPPSPQLLTLSGVSGVPFTVTGVTASWLEVTPRSGTVPAQLRVTLNTSALAVGSYSGIISILTDNRNNLTASVSVVVFADPALPTLANNGIVNAASQAREASVGSWISIFGRNLSQAPSPGRGWSSSEIINGILPTSLDGVSVLIDGRQAALSFVGPGQINAQVPDTTRTGIAPVEVRTPSGTARGTILLSVVTPALFTVATLEGFQLAAAVHLDGTLVGNPATLPGSRPARRGDVIGIFGAGFGPTDPPRFAGRLIEPAPLRNQFLIRIGDQLCQALFGGIVGPGLYQFNIEVPDLPSGNHPVEIEVLGVRSQAGVGLPIVR